METHLKATERHLPYGITQCHLPPDTGNAPRRSPNQAGWYSTYPGNDGRMGRQLETEMVYLSIHLVATRARVEPNTT